jgi:hypothetical protein
VQLRSALGASDSTPGRGPKENNGKHVLQHFGQSRSKLSAESDESLRRLAAKLPANSLRTRVTSIAAEFHHTYYGADVAADLRSSSLILTSQTRSGVLTSR